MLPIPRENIKLSYWFPWTELFLIEYLGLGTKYATMKELQVYSPHTFIH